MVSAHPHGRVFALHRRPQLADCAPSGRTRLDALARWVQDVAYADMEAAGLDRLAIWVLRRHRIRVLRFPVFGERCEVRTFCSGIGRMWAERRTTVTLAPASPAATAEDTSDQSPVTAANPQAGSPLVETVGLWVHLDPEHRLPSPITEAEREIYAAAAGNRSISSRLRHPRPGADATEIGRAWHFRRTEVDIADHVNNAAYWEPLEDELIESLPALSQVDAELEFRVPAQPGPVRILGAGPRRWLTATDGREIYASALLINAVSSPAQTVPAAPSTP